MSSGVGLLLTVVIATTVWVAIDARGRTWPRNIFATGAAGWTTGNLLMWIVYFPAYLHYRAQAPHVGQSAMSPGVVAGAPAASVAAPLTGSSGEFKPCPECAEAVRAAARKCRFCGHRFDELLDDLS